MSQTLVILRGGPSSGKSAVCEKILEKDRRIVWLHVDSFKRFVSSGNDDNDRDYWYGAATSSLDYFLDNGFSVIAECVFQNHKHVNLFLETARKHSVKAKVFELVADPVVLIKRDKQRKGVLEGLRAALPEETIKKLALQINNNHFPGAEIIRTDKEDLERTVEKVWMEFL